MNVDYLSRRIYNSLLADTKGDEIQVFIDPVTISIIVSVIIEVIKLMKNCKKTDENVVRTLHNPNIIERRILRRTIRKKLGIRRYIKTGRPIYNSVLKESSKISDSEIRVMYNEGS